MDDTLPTTKEQLYSQFAPLVVGLVTRKVKYGLSRPDVISELWVRLLTADVLGKFHASTTAALPATRARLRNYLRKAAMRHLSNIFRTHERRFAREDLNRHEVMDEDGERWANWEDTLPSRAITPERFCVVMSDLRLRWQARAQLAELEPS